MIDTKLPADLPSADDKRESLAKRQANAAVALLRMNQPAKVWPLLKHSPDPRVRSYLIHRLGPLGAEAAAIVKQLDMESDLTILRALVLSLGEYGETDFTPDDPERLAAEVAGDVPDSERPGPSCGMRMASAALETGGVADTGERRLGEGQGAATETAGGHRERFWRTDKEKTPPQWYVNTARDKRWW